MYNSDIDLTNFKNVDAKILRELDEEFFNLFKTLPENFSWHLITTDDSPNIIQKKKNISKVQNQHLCGCCWAISCATAISDAFVISNIVDYPPNISYTYALARYPQQKCSGGSSRILLEEIKNGDGITSNYCVDDSWCLNDQKCSQSAIQHFNHKDKEYLSSLIPETGCYDGSKYHFVYNLDDVYSFTLNDHLKVFEIQIKIKQHIMVRGPVVGGFLIMENFLNFNNGIYFENAEYTSANNVVYYLDENNEKIIGSHSVVIVGWGLEKNYKFNDFMINVPYWYCRNSWGENWGENGYFKIAMYPYNKICQFTKRVKIIHKNVIKEVGGVTGFKVSRPPVLRKINSNNFKKKIHQPHYNIDENLIYGKTEFEKQHNFDWSILLLGFSLLIFFLRT